ncbi:hypothetical protein MO973_02860 [Paenibacillus sp. TRM 82003]|nr:hypothetical protein [Paenibacillus sp. TRM 82003]
MVILKHSFITVVVVIVVNVIGSLFNMEQNTMVSFIISTLFLVTWFLYGTMQTQRNLYFLFITLYPVVGIILGLLFHLFPTPAFADMLQFIYAKAMRGYYFLEQFLYNQKIIVEYIIFFVLPSIFGLLGYLSKEIVPMKRKTS